MEVTNVGQGRQIALDTSMKTNVGENQFKSEKLTVSDKNVNDKEKTIDSKELKKSVDKLNKFLEDENLHVEYEVHDKLKDVMIKIVNTTTKEVVMEIPPKKILDMVAKMCEMVGVLVDKKA